MFRKYHYLNTELNNSAEFYIGTINNELVCCAGVIQFPMRKGWKRVHRLVVLPDYQGIGIGTKFITEIGRMVKARGYELNLTTSSPSIVNALIKHEKWKLTRYGRNSDYGFKRYGKQSEHLNKTASSKRVTYSFYYKEREIET